MADVFISYSSKDRDLAEALARDIVAAGWSVWWDPEIRAGENYRDVILRELDAAKAVAVIWTKNSVNSDWVISEASRAMRKPRDRYIAVREDGLDEHDIPPPFDVRHAVRAEQNELLMDALSRLLNPLERINLDLQISANQPQPPTADEEESWQALIGDLKKNEQEDWWKTEDMIIDYLAFLERYPAGFYSKKVAEVVDGGINYFGSESAGGHALATMWEAQLQRIRGR